MYIKIGSFKQAENIKTTHKEIKGNKLIGESSSVELFAIKQFDFLEGIIKGVKDGDI